MSPARQDALRLCGQISRLAFESIPYTKVNLSLSIADHLFHEGKYTDTIPAGGFYESWSGYNDEIVWAAAWIAKATGNQADVDKAEALWAEMAGGNANPSEVSWDDKWAITFLVMYDITGKVTNKSIYFIAKKYSV